MKKTLCFPIHTHPIPGSIALKVAWCALWVLVLLLCGAPTKLQAQYPRVSKADSARAQAKFSEEDRRSDAAFASAMPAIESWALKGKPYLPGAATPGDLPQASIPAFPGAWGGGMYSHGGRGGRVYVVTHLGDQGPGSFREACEAGGPRIVVFNVAGIIRLEEVLRIRAPYITISGATAPGDGICIAGDTVELETHDVIVRHMRFRRGATWVGDRNDSFGGNPVGNIMIDHVSASWGLDENMSMYRHMYDDDADPKTVDLKLPTVNITIQYSVFSEALNTFHHAFGSTIGGLNSTFHHNLWACNTGRNPSVGMYGDFTFANNVMFNWRHRTVDGGDHRSFFNIINNYLKPGPVTPRDQPIAYRLLKPESERSKTVVDHFGKAYVHGNFVEGYPEVSRDNWMGGVQPDSVAPVDQVIPSIRSDEPTPYANLPLQEAKEAYLEVLDMAGARLPRQDAVDRRVMEMVRSGVVTAQAPDGVRATLENPNFNAQMLDKMIDEISKGIITHPDQVGGYPNYQGKPYLDADQDGMPDSWEKKHDLDPQDPSDASGDADEDGYTNIEEFINQTHPRAFVDYGDLSNNQ